MTAQEIINYADLKHYNVETDANKVIYLNKIQKEIFTKLQRLSHQYTVDTTSVTTVADQAEYDFPTGVRIEDVEKIEVATSDGSDYDLYTYAGVEDEITSRKVYQRGSTSAKFYLYDDEDAISYGSATVRIYYYPRPTEITSGDLSVTPDLDEEYHNLLCYALIVELCNQGDNPDYAKSDYYQAKYEEFEAVVVGNMSSRYAKNPAITDTYEWW